MENIKIKSNKKPDSKDFLRRIGDKSIGLIATLFTYLVYTYFSSFVTQAQFSQYQQDQNLKEANMSAKIDSLHTKFDNTLTGMCIIESKTCKLKEIK